MLIYQNDKLQIHRLVLNTLKTNCYIIQNGSDAILVDPTDNSEAIIKYLKDLSLGLKFMIATHGHFDHISAANGIIESGLADKMYIHERDFKEVDKAPTYSAMLIKKKIVKPVVEIFSQELIDYLKLLGIEIRHYGGHTRGSSCFCDINKEFIITGDLNLHHKLTITLIDTREDKLEYLNFIQDMKKGFNPETIIFPGHGDMTNIRDELLFNKKWQSIQEKYNGN